MCSAKTKRLMPVQKGKTQSGRRNTPTAALCSSHIPGSTCGLCRGSNNVTVGLGKRHSSFWNLHRSGTTFYGTHSIPANTLRMAYRVGYRTSYKRRSPLNEMLVPIAPHYSKKRFTIYCRLTIRGDPCSFRNLLRAWEGVRAVKSTVTKEP